MIDPGEHLRVTAAGEELCPSSEDEKMNMRWPGEGQHHLHPSCLGGVRGGSLSSTVDVFSGLTIMFMFFEIRTREKNLHSVRPTLC